MDKLGSIAHQKRLTLWIQRIQDCRKSGMTVATWCQQNNVGTKSYYYWLRKIRLEALESFQTLPAISSQTESALPSSSSFAEVKLPPAASHGNAPAIVLDVNGAKIQIYNAASQATIASTLAAIRMIASERTSC